MVTAHDIAQEVGRKVISERLGVGVKAISNACVSGKFPASWYSQIKELCEGAGIDCPMEAFNWKSPAEAGAE